MDNPFGYKRSVLTLHESLIMGLMALLIAWSFGIHYMLFFISSVIGPLLIRKKKFVGHEPIYLEKYRAAEKIAEQRLVLLRKLIDLSLTYQGNTELFHRKFREAVHIDQIRKECIVDFGAMAPEPDREVAARSQGDIEFHLLCAHGFTHRELSVIYNHSNLHSIYVRQSRVRRRNECRTN